MSSSFEIVRASGSVLRSDPDLAWLPVLSLGSAGIAVALFGSGIVVTSRSPTGTHYRPASIALVFVLYLVLSMIGAFFNAALVSAAARRMRGEDPTLRLALSDAASKLRTIAPWALVSATVSTVLAVIQQRVGFLGRIIAGITGIAWTLVTFLVLPIIVIEGVSVREALQRSKDLFGRTWGEQVVGNASIDVASLFAVLVVAPIPLIGWASGITALKIAGFLIRGLWFVAVMLIGSALSGIFQTALYLYASTGEVPAGFTPAQIGSAFRPKSD